MSLASIRGQARALRLLRPLLASRRLPPALLFYGPEGVGKAATAVELGKALNCLKPTADGDGCDRGLSRGSAALQESVGKAADGCASCQAAAKGIDPDLKRVNAAYQAGLREEEAEKQRTLRVDTVRHLLKDVEMTSLTGRWKVVVLEDAERLETEAANALLKTLEEPPPRTLWILVTGRRERLLPTILSRCHRVPFGALPEAEVAAVLRERLPAGEVGRLARLAEGSPGRALALRALEVPEPEEWAGDPLAPFKLAEGLPRELHLQRRLVEAHLRRIAWRVRDRGLRRGSRGASAALRELSKLSAALRSNADPRLILELAALELEQAR